MGYFISRGQVSQQIVVANEQRGSLSVKQRTFDNGGRFWAGVYRRKSFRWSRGTSEVEVPGGDVTDQFGVLFTRQLGVRASLDSDSYQFIMSPGKRQKKTPLPSRPMSSGNVVFGFLGYQIWLTPTDRGLL